MHYRQPLFPLVVGLTLIVVGLGIAAVQQKPAPAAKPTAPAVTRAVRFDACGDTAVPGPARAAGASACQRVVRRHALPDPPGSDEQRDALAAQ